MLFLTLFSAWAAWAQPQPSATSLPECYTTNTGAGSNGNATPGSTAPTAAAGVSSIIGGSCGEFADFAPAFYLNKDLPALPIKTVRLIFHVMQKDDGSENWKEPSRDLGADETILRGYIDGLTQWPAGGQPIRGANGIFSQLNPRITAAGTAVVPAVYDDTRIRFKIEAVRYYRSTRYWNMSNGLALGCEGGGCLPEFYRTFVTNTATNPGITGVPLDADQQNNVIHVFFGETPGGPGGAALDRFGNPGSRYRIGGAASGVPGNSIMMRGHYWSLRHHPYWAPGQLTNPNDPQASFRNSAFVMAHELGHCLGLGHTFDGDGCSLQGVSDPPALTKGASNNIMDYPGFPGYSLSQCQIGAMHDALSSTFIDVTQVRDHWTRWTGVPTQDNVITQSQTWSTIHNLRSNLYVNDGVILTVRCRIGMLGPDAKIVVRRGGQLIFDGGSLGNYATSRVNEAPQNLRVRLGGDPNDLNDADHSGLVEFRGPGCRLTSAKMSVELMAGATLHLAGTARLDINKALLTTRTGSYFCVSDGARITRTSGGNFVTDTGTNFGIGPDLGPNIIISPTPQCAPTLCALNGKLLSLTGSVPANTAFCQTGGPVTLIVTGQPVPLPPGYSYQWFFNNTSISNGPSATVTHTPPNNTGTSSVTHLYHCRVQRPGCPDVVLDYPVIINPVVGTTAVESANPLAVCVPSPYGLYRLAELVPRVFGVSNPGQVKWGGRFVSYLGSYVFDVAAAVAAGITQPTITVTLVPAGANQCVIPADITLNLLLGPVFTVTASAAVVCPTGQATRLDAAVPAGTSVIWQPDNSSGPLSGTSVLVTPTITTTYTATATNGLGCSSRRTVTVTVRPPNCPVCEPDVVEMNPVQFRNPTTQYSGGYEFSAGRTYYFSASTRLIAGKYTAEPGAVLVFGDGAYLTVSKQACLVLEGATLTATCDKQWGGIRVESTGSISARNTDKTGRFYNEISHSQDGIELQEKGFTPNPACPVALDLDGVRFRHNFRSVQLFMEVYRNVGQNRITNCIFEADPQQMLAPYAYQSPQRQWCSYAHLSLGGQALDVKLEGNTLRGALFGIWAPEVGNITATRNTFSDCYIAGAFNLFNGDAGTWNRNTFNLADPYNDFIHQENDFVNAAYEDLAALGNVPGEISTPGTAVGLCASGEPLTVDGNQFLQALDRGNYTGENYAPQTGLWAGPGTALLRRNVFQNLQSGATAQARQPAGGRAEGNTFADCRVGLTFINRDPSTPPGDVKLTCNTFVRPNDKEGDSFALYLGPGPYVPGQAGRQVNIAEEISTLNGQYVPILQTNRFVGLQPPPPLPPPNPQDVQTYWHLYNDGDNAPFVYTRYNASADPLNPVVVVGDATIANPGLLGMNTRTQYQRGVNDCATLGYPAGVGLRPAPTVTGPALTPYHLAQNAPNPCSGSTSVSYWLPAGETGELVVRDAFGGRVWLRQLLSAGERTVDLRLEKLPPGAYHYSLEVNGRSVAHHQLLVK